MSRKFHAQGIFFGNVSVGETARVSVAPSISPDSFLIAAYAISRPLTTLDVLDVVDATRINVDLRTAGEPVPTLRGGQVPRATAMQVRGRGVHDLDSYENLRVASDQVITGSRVTLRSSASNLCTNLFL